MSFDRLLNNLVKFIHFLQLIYIYMYISSLNEFELIQNITSGTETLNPEPVCNEDIQKIVSEWQQLLSMDVSIPILSLFETL